MDVLVNYSLNWYDTKDKIWCNIFRLWEDTYGVGMKVTCVTATSVNISTNKTNTINWSNRTTKAYVILEYTKTTD